MACFTFYHSYFWTAQTKVVCSVHWKEPVNFLVLSVRQGASFELIHTTVRLFLCKRKKKKKILHYTIRPLEITGINTDYCFHVFRHTLLYSSVYTSSFHFPGSAVTVATLVTDTSIEHTLLFDTHSSKIMFHT